MPKPEKRSIVFKDALGGDASAITPDHPQAVAAADPVEPVEVVKPAARVEPAAAPAHSDRDADSVFFKVPVLILERTALTPSEKMILVSLCYYADETGLAAPPSKRMLGMVSGITEYWARETLKGLEAKGYIKTVDESRRRCKYQLMF